LDIAEQGPVSRLRWYPQRGFELDLNAIVDDVSVMLVAVPLPADGTVELRKGDLELDKLEILFKAQVDVDGAPGQLTRAKVRVVKEGQQDRIELEAQVEDAESGERRDILVRCVVDVPAEAPVSGGPRPRPATEAELDWEDEDTFEAFFKDPLTQEDPLPVADRPRKADDEGKSGKTPVPVPQRGKSASDGKVPGKAASGSASKPAPPAPRPAQKGFDRLLQALLAGDDEDGEGDVSDEVPRSGRAAPERVGPRLVAAETEGPSRVEDPADARGLLNLLVEQGQLELEDGASVDDLVPGAAPILASPKKPHARAKALSEWLFDVPGVAELFIDDEALAQLIARW
jgi:hypothetical protein